MLLYVGEKEKGFYIEDIAHKFGEDVTYTGYMAHASGLADKMTQDSYKHIVIDIEQFVDDYTRQVLEITRARNVSGANIIIQAIGYPLRSEIVQGLADQGITNFIIAPLLTQQKEQFESSIRGTNTVLQDGEPEPPPSIAQDAEKPTSTSSKENIHTHVIMPRTISVAGCCHRIGTTTQAIQVIKFLHLQGYTACYLEINNSRFVEQLQQLYSVADCDRKLGKVVYRGIDMYFDKKMYPYVLTLPYDFFVYDYGVFSDDRFDLISYFDKSRQIAVCGCFPNEFESMGEAVKKTLQNDVAYIFSFCSEDEQKDILEQMEDKADQTFFASYIPDAFIYSSNNNPIYQKSLQTQPRTEGKKKRGLFRKGGER